MIRVCPICSNVNIDKLKSEVGEENVKKGCVGMCRAFSTESFGRINNEVTIFQTEKEFIDACKKAYKK